MYKFGFVILHYKTDFDTIECISSLLMLKGNIEIIVVDNFSDNGSIEKVYSHFKDVKNVHFLYNGKNLGFAKGNNEGMVYAKKIGCDFVCLLNNDTFIKQKDFVEIAINDWLNSNYSISGPKIISAIDGLDQNPFMVPRHYVKNKLDAVILFMIGFIKYVFVLLHFPAFWEKSGDKGVFTEGLENEYLLSEKREFLLNGACMIFSPTYLRKYNKICDLTFMYEEETIIFYLSNKLGYLLSYNPNIEIYHKEQSATNHSINKPRERLVFGYKQDLKSRFVMLKIVFINENRLKYLLI